MDASAAVRLTLFGSPTVEQSATVLALPFERRTQLLVLLALRRGWVPRAELAALLWPEQESKLAFTNLRKTLFRLQSLPWAAALQAPGSALRFEAETDVVAFETALRDERLDDALALYRGELLAGFDDGQSQAWTRWLDFERERLRAAWRAAALARLGAADLAAPAAIALSARLLEADPLDEAALRAQMSALARDGQAGAARAAYRAFVDRLASDLGLEPGAALRALHDSLAVPTVAAPASAAPVTAPDDGFIGRSIELQRIASLLARDECRLLCLIGPGGVGKTRLAQRALHTLAAGFAPRALFVPVEDSATPAQFAAALGRALGLTRGARAADPLEPAIESLRGRAMLLVLDNFEQLAEHAGLLDRLLQGCAHLKLLVTSRVRLAVAGEWSMPLEGLPCPDPEDEDRAAGFDAVRLFVRAAQRVEPSWAASSMPAAEAAAVVDICRQVEGLPLALELAAAWVRVLPCAAIAAELRQGTELLRAVDASRPARHASIEIVFEQSWRRLGGAERDALARLSVFSGGFSVEAARAVSGALLPVLGALADKSLLAKDGARMHLHPLVQQLAALRLDAKPEVHATTEAAHAAWFQRWLARLAHASEEGERDTLQAIDREIENVRRAWRFAVAHGQADALAACVATLVSHCEHRARFEDGLALLREAIDSPLVQADNALHALLLGRAALLELRLARYDDAQASAARALAVARAARGAREHDTRFQATSVLAGCALFTGRVDEARRLYQQALALARIGALPHDIAATLENLALAEKRAGRYDESLRLSIEALAQQRRIGNQASVALGLSNLASMYLFMHDDAAAQAHLREALALSERHGLVSTRAFVLANLTELALKADDTEAARTHAERALEVAHSTGMRALAGWLQVQLARLAARRGELDGAHSLLAGAAELALTLGAQTLKAAVLLGLAELMEARGHAAPARRVLAFGVDQEAISAPDRDELRTEWARRASSAQADPPWPGIALDELLQRIVIEREPALGGLIAALGGGG